MEEVSISSFFDELSLKGYINNKKIIENDQWIEVNEYLKDYKHSTIQITSCDFKDNNLNFSNIYKSKVNDIKLIEFKNLDCQRLTLNRIKVDILKIENSNLYDVKLDNTEINVLNIQNTQFDEFVGTNIYNNDILFIHDCKFNTLKLFTSESKKVNLNNIDINKVLDFFSNNIDFLRINLINSLDFEIKGCIINKDLYFNNLTNVNELILNDNRFNGSFLLNNISSYDLDLNNNHFDKSYATLNNLQFDNSNVETYRILKMFALKNSDNINYLIYNKLEQNEILKKNDIMFSDKIILYIKKIISNHGTDWVQAFFTTLIFTLIVFYTPTFFFLNDNSRFCDIYSSNFWNGFLKYLNITDYSNPFLDQKLPIKNFWANLIFYLGKIFLGIGIYETIISFRKYHK